MHDVSPLSIAGEGRDDCSAAPAFPTEAHVDFRITPGCYGRDDGARATQRGKLATVATCGPAEDQMAGMSVVATAMTSAGLEATDPAGSPKGAQGEEVSLRPSSLPVARRRHR